MYADSFVGGKSIQKIISPNFNISDWVILMACQLILGYSILWGLGIAFIWRSYLHFFFLGGFLDIVLSNINNFQTDLFDS